MRKPFILVGGIDPSVEGEDKYRVNSPGNNSLLGYGNVRWDVLVTGRDQSFDEEPDNMEIPHTPVFELMPNIFQQLIANGFDVIFVDFEDGGDYIQANGNFVIKVIERVNQVKIGSEENIVLGASMGGLVCRYALAKMENNNNPHCTGMFFTFDSPHNGANIPLGLQALGYYFHQTSPADDDTQQALWRVLDVPAALQQSILHLGTAAQTGKVAVNTIFPYQVFGYATPVDLSELYNRDYSVLRNQLLTEFTELGWPIRCRKIAILDGKKNGSSQFNEGMNPGEKYYDGSIYATTLDLGTVFKSTMASNNGNGVESYAINGMDNCAKHSIYPDVPNMIFAMSSPSDFNDCVSGRPPYKHYFMHVSSTSNLPFTDNCAGGYRMDILSVNAAFKKAGEGQEFINPVKIPKMCFIPTWSSLAMSTPLENSSLFFDLGAGEYNPDILPTAKIPHFDHYYAPDNNLRHVELNQPMVDYVLGQINGFYQAIPSGTLATTYNYGLYRKNIPAFTITSGGVLNVNNTGATGFVSSNAEMPALKPIFTTYLGGCGANLVTVSSGGTINLGALNASQHGITEVTAGATLHIQAGGTLRITSAQSKLVVRPGATLILDAGANIILANADSKIEIHGRLIINGNINFSGNGFWEWHKGNELVYGAGVSTFTLNGTGQANRLAVLLADVQIPATRSLDWNNGLVNFSGGALRCDWGANVNLTNMELLKGNSAVEANYFPGAVALAGCKVHHLEIPIALSGGNSASNTWISGCNFSDIGFRAIQQSGASSTLRVLNSQFIGAGNSRALDLTDVQFVLLNKSTFSGYNTPNNKIQVQSINNPQGLQAFDAAVRIENVQFCVSSGSSFTNNDIAILDATDEFGTLRPSNVFLVDQTTLTNNKVGVFMRGNNTGGLVMADCAVFTNNHWGIAGHDITLFIDGYNNDHWLDQNQAVRMLINPSGANNQKYINICYQAKQLGSSPLMRRNFWGTTNSNASVTNPNAYIRLLSGSNCNIQTLANVSDMMLTNSFSGCAYNGLIGGGGGDEIIAQDCAMQSVIGSSTSDTKVRQQFKKGIAKLKEGDYLGSLDFFAPVSGLYDGLMNSYTANCKQYVAASRAIVEGFGNNLNKGGSDPRSQDLYNLLDDSKSLRIAPNPAAEVVRIGIPTEMTVDLRIYDTFGRVVHEAASLEGVYTLPLLDWKSGMYIIEALPADGSRAIHKVLMVQGL